MTRIGSFFGLLFTIAVIGAILIVIILDELIAGKQERPKFQREYDPHGDWML